MSETFLHFYHHPLPSFHRSSLPEISGLGGRSTGFTSTSPSTPFSLSLSLRALFAPAIPIAPPG